MNEEKEKVGETASFDPSPNTEFLREKIKQKPINKKKLIRRTGITVLLAAIFGVVACVTFLILEPLISEGLSRRNEPDEVKPSQVTLTETDEADEILPEDMYANDTEMIKEAIQGNVDSVNQDIQHIEEMISDLAFGLDDYQRLYAELRSVANSFGTSLVTVAGYTSETTLFDNAYENSSQISGLIVADNGASLLILVKDIGISDSDKIQITFVDESICDGHILGKDNETGYMVLAVPKSTVGVGTLANIRVASFGTSQSSTLKGTPVIAVGAPTGETGSVAYGMVTSNSHKVGVIDSDYSLMSTDISGNNNSSGVLISLRGNVIGIIDNSFNAEGTNNQISAVGITELKSLIERLSNGSNKAYLGVKGTDITPGMIKAYNLPEGVYISYVELDSPAMNAGLQTGDILVSWNNEELTSYSQLADKLSSVEPESSVALKIKRQSVDSYVPLNIEVTLGSISYSWNKED